MRSDARDGFTLLELLIALAIFSLAALALIRLTGESIRSQARVETRTLGGIIADNVVVEALVGPPLPVGRSEGVEILAGREWTWTREVAETEDADLRRVSVTVRTEGENASDRTAYRRQA